MPAPLEAAALEAEALEAALLEAVALEAALLEAAALEAAALEAAPLVSGPWAGSMPGAAALLRALVQLLLLPVPLEAVVLLPPCPWQHWLLAGVADLRAIARPYCGLLA